MLRSLVKKIAAAWKAARKWGTMKKMNLSGEPKETAVSQEIMPADGSNPAQRNKRGFRHVPAYDRQLITESRRGNHQSYSWRS